MGAGLAALLGGLFLKLAGSVLPDVLKAALLKLVDNAGSKPAPSAADQKNVDQAAAIAAADRLQKAEARPHDDDTTSADLRSGRF
jgi:hypothetical protein